jgi:hypothetical protein
MVEVVEIEVRKKFRESKNKVMVEKSENNKEVIIQEIKNRLRFIIELSIFFPTIIYFFYSINAISKANEMALSFSQIIPIYLANYILFEILKRGTTTNWLKIINFLVLVGIGLFIFPGIQLCTSGNSFRSLTEFICTMASLYGIFLLPWLIFLFILFTPLIYWDSKRIKNKRFLGFDF